MATSNTIIYWRKHLTTTLPDPLCEFCFVEFKPQHPTQDVVSLLQHTIGGTMVELGNKDMTPAHTLNLWQVINPYNLVEINKAKNFVRSIPKSLLEELIKDWKNYGPKDDSYFDDDIKIIEAAMNA